MISKLMMSFKQVREEVWVYSPHIKFKTFFSSVEYVVQSDNVQRQCKTKHNNFRFMTYLLQWTNH